MTESFRNVCLEDVQLYNVVYDLDCSEMWHLIFHFICPLCLTLWHIAILELNVYNKIYPVLQ